MPESEKTLARMNKYRRTWKLIDGWRAPDLEGFGTIVVCRKEDLQVDIVLEYQGHSVRALNLEPCDREECDALLDFMKDTLLAEVSRAYASKEADEDVILAARLDLAARAFHEGLESARCKGKGGDE